MQIETAVNLACPLDGEALERQGGSYRCCHGHSFDVARQGYINLLPVQFKKSKAPGDSKAMIEARTRFLDAGFYTPVAERMLALIGPLSTRVQGGFCLLDAGCGEGYYLEQLVHGLSAGAYSHDGGPLSVIGMDISKPAVHAAARRSRQITWLVASNRQIPLLDNSVDVALCMFGYPDYEQFRRVLRPGGHVVLVEAGEDHLLQLRELIYPEVRKKRIALAPEAGRCGFELVDEQRLHYAAGVLRADQVQDLTLMTPHLFRASCEGKSALAQVDELALTVDVSFRLLELQI